MKHHIEFERHGLFDARVPRYTSYPPANRFRAIADKAPSWLANIPAGEAVSFYMHIPFCRRLCWFCACRTQGTKTDAPVANYVRHLGREIDIAAEHMDKVRAERIHFGGGTPTLLQPDMIGALMDRFDARFSRTRTAEFSVEIDPTEVDRTRLSALASAGMSRASLGVQDFDPRVQAAIGRPQSYAQTQACVEDLRHLGIANINLDILYGLPFQTESTLAATLRQVLSLDPDRIAAFGYAHVPWMSKRQTLIPESALPDPKARLRLFELLADTLLDQGYVQIGIDHFVKPHDGLARAVSERRLHRNFQGYTDDASRWLIGLGASAISRYPEGYLHNATSTADYLGHVGAGQFATRRGIEMTAEQHVTAALIERLMCYGRIEVDDVVATTGTDAASIRTRLARIAEQYGELVTFRGNALHVPRSAWPLLRLIAARLDDVAVEGRAHAIAV